MSSKVYKGRGSTERGEAACGEEMARKWLSGEKKKEKCAHRPSSAIEDCGPCSTAYSDLGRTDTGALYSDSSWLLLTRGGLICCCWCCGRVQFQPFASPWPVFHDCVQ